MHFPCTITVSVSITKRFKLLKICQIFIWFERNDLISENITNLDFFPFWNNRKSIFNHLSSQKTLTFKKEKWPSMKGWYFQAFRFYHKMAYHKSNFFLRCWHLPVVAVSSHWFGHSLHFVKQNVGWPQYNTSIDRKFISLILYYWPGAFTYWGTYTIEIDRLDVSWPWTHYPWSKFYKKCKIRMSISFSNNCPFTLKPWLFVCLY